MHIKNLSLPLFVAAVLIAGPLASAQSVTSTTSTTTTSGLVSEMAPDALVIRTQNSAVPIRYLSSSSTTFVDETGAPVAREVVASGLPVTVDYIRDGERMIASRVVVHRRTTTTTAPGTTTTTTTPGTPAVVEKTTTITPPPVVVEKRVEVPVEKKVYVDRPVDRPVIVEKKVPVDRPVIVEKKVPVDRPVIVEKPVPAPAVEEKRTTTTTTTTKKAKKDDDDD